MAKWEVKKDGETKCWGDCLQTLPSDDVLAGMQGFGYRIYVDGKLYKVQKKGRKNEQD